MMRQIDANEALREAYLAIGEAVLQQRLMAAEIVRLEAEVDRLTPPAAS